MPEASTLVVLAVAVSVGAGLNAASGFGFSLLSVPVMAAVLGPREAVVLSAVLGAFSNGAVAVRNRLEVDRPIGARLMAGSLVGMPVGVLVLSKLDERPLQILIGLAVLATAGVLASGWRLEHPHPRTDVGAGLLSGMFKTSVGFSGPPVVVLLQGRGLPKARFRATSAAVIEVVGLVSLVLFGLAGHINRAVLVGAAVTLPVMPVGYWVGNRVHDSVPEERFRYLVLSMVVTSAILALLEVARS
ncbi:MAG: sulfite exporter TauE/SafE family protein [Microthrixaceae bacterium]